MPSFTSRPRAQRALAAAVVCTALLTTTAAAAVPQERPACPPGYELGALTFESIAQLYAGLYTEEQVAAAIALHDLNGNGVLCFKQPPAFSQVSMFELHPYLYIDDPGGNPR